MIGQPFVLFLGVLVVLVCLAVALGGGGRRRRVAKRAEAVRKRVTTSRQAPIETVILRSDAKSRSFLDNVVRRLVPRQSILRDRLARTGRNIGPGNYIAFCLLLAVVVGVLMFRLGGFGVILSVATGIGVGIWIPHVIVGRMGRKWINRFVEMFPEAIELMVRGLKSGLPISECVAVVGQEMSAPVGTEFRAVAERVHLGTSLEDALWSMAKRLDVPEFRFFVISLSVQRETGGNLAQTLANLADVLRRRRQMALKVKAMSSEARASALILGSLPFLMFTIICLLNPDYETQLFTDPRGRMMLLFALGMIAVGIGVMRKMVRFEI